MSITWKELQETCLRKMDSLDGAALAKDSNNAACLYGMPAAANEALMLLATNGRYWKKLLTITQKEGETATKGEPLGGFLAYDLRQLAEGFYCIDKIKLASGTDYGTYSGYMMEVTMCCFCRQRTKGRSVYGTTHTPRGLRRRQRQTFPLTCTRRRRIMWRTTWQGSFSSMTTSV